MTNPKRRTLPAVVAGALGMGAAVAAWAQPSQQDLMTQVNELQAKVASLENQQAAKAAEVQATVASVLRDADTHSLAMTGGSAGHGEGPGFNIVQGDFSLNIQPGMQFRFVANYGDERKHGEDGEFDTGYEVTRARLALSGMAWDPALTYYFQWDMGDINGGVSLLDACVRYQIADQFALQSGQFKDFYYHEWSVGDFELLGSTRSLANGLIGVPEGSGGRIQGSSLWYGTDRDAIHAAVAIHDGLGSGNTDYADTVFQWGVTGRVEWKMMGEWKDYSDFTARMTKTDLLVLGAGVDCAQGDNFTGYKFAIDGQFETANLSLFGAILGRYIDPRNVANDDSSTDWGFVVQAGYAFGPQWEIFGRVDMTIYDTETAFDEDTFMEVDVGVNYYLGRDGAAGNNAKVTVDVAWVGNGAPNALPYDDIIGGSDQMEVVFRAQLQFRP